MYFFSKELDFIAFILTITGGLGPKKNIRTWKSAFKLSYDSESSF